MFKSNFFVFASLLVMSFKTACGGDRIKAFFPVSNSTIFPRLRLVGTLPDLHELTFCSWMKLYDTKTNAIFLFSYATGESYNQMSISLGWRNNHVVIRVYIGLHLEFICAMLDSVKEYWNHICMTWSMPNGKTEVFVNSDKCATVTTSTISAGNVISGGGVVIIGQDQDALDSKFNSNQSWYGDIADVQLWDEVLTRSQIEEAGKCGGKRKKGNVIAWLRTPMMAIDGVVFLETQLCQP